MKLACVVWLDATYQRDVEPDTMRRIWPIRSFGRIIRRDSEGLLLEQSRGPDGLSDVLNIPEGMVLSVVYYRKEKS